MENNQKTVKELLEEYKAEKGVKICPRASQEEAETIINYDPITEKWYVYSTILPTISKIVRENLITEIVDVYYIAKDGKRISSIEGVLLKAPSMFSATPRKVSK